LRFFLSDASRVFLPAPALFLFGLPPHLFLRGTSRLFRRESLCFFLCTTTSFVFRTLARLFLGTTLHLGFGSHLCLDLRAQPCLLFSTLQSFGFGHASGFFFDASPLRFFRQQPSFFGRLYARVLAQSQPQDFLFNRSEAHLSATPHLVFLGALPRFSFKKAPLLINTNTRLFRFKFSDLFQFSLMCGGGGLKLRFDFGAPGFFHGAHAAEFFLNALQFFIGNPAARFFSRAFARFSFDAKLLLLGACDRRLLLFLAPMRRLLVEGVFGREARSFELSATRCLLVSHAC
jgi:hypothetical protein